jgi:hypothetical protein
MVGYLIYPHQFELGAHFMKAIFIKKYDLWMKPK